MRLSEWPLWSTWESRLSNALPGSMADYSAPSGLFDGLEWVSGLMNVFIRRKANRAEIIGYAAKGTSWGPIGMENSVMASLRRWQVMGVSIPAQPAVGLPKGRKEPRLTIRRLAGERMIRLAGSGFSDRVTQNRLDVNRGGERRTSRAKIRRHALKIGRGWRETGRAEPGDFRNRRAGPARLFGQRD